MQAGDQVLRSCAQVLQASVRGSDQVARFSGKEFLVLLPGADAVVARQVAQRMLEAIGDTAHVTDAGTVRLTASIGLATFTPQQRFPNAQALLGAADHALYAATLRGRNRYECFEDL